MARRPLALGSLILVSVVMVKIAHAQEPCAGGVCPPPTDMSGPPYGDTGWRYPGLSGGPYIGCTGALGAYGNLIANGLHHGGSHGCRPPILTYGPVPDVHATIDYARQWRSHPVVAPGFGWFGVFGASPRPQPATVSVWPPATVSAAPAGGACLVLAVSVPAAGAEVFVEGAKTEQTGTDRVFESPPLPAGDYRYAVVARWVEGGTAVERTRVVTGRPGEVVKVAFSRTETAGR